MTSAARHWLLTEPSPGCGPEGKQMTRPHGSTPAASAQAGPQPSRSRSRFRLRYAGQSATVVEVGGAIRSYTAAGRPVLDGYGPGERCSGARGQTLIPWPNRLRDGTYTFEGTNHQLPLTEPGKHNAIHGLARWASWLAARHDEDRVTMTCVLFPQPGWPFTLDLSIDYQLGPAGLSVRTTATNTGTASCPYGAGAHPYLTLGTGIIDPLILRAPGAIRLRTDDQAIPAGTEPAEGTGYDFRTARAIGPAVLDTGYTDLCRDGDGMAWVELADPAGGTAVPLWLDETCRYLMLFTGDSLADPARRRQRLGVEPMTCAPNALQTGDGLHVLAPGESFGSAWGIPARIPLRRGHSHIPSDPWKAHNRRKSS